MTYSNGDIVEYVGRGRRKPGETLGIVLDWNERRKEYLIEWQGGNVKWVREKYLMATGIGEDTQ